MTRIRMLVPWLLGVATVLPASAFLLACTVVARAQSTPTPTEARSTDATSYVYKYVDEFKGREYYDPLALAAIQEAQRYFYPYISYSPETESRTLFGRVRTIADDWLMLDGVIVLVGEERYEYCLDGLELLGYRQSDVHTSGRTIQCAEFVDLPFKLRDAEFAMCRAVAAAPESADVRVRAHGTDGHVDWTMSSIETQAWRDIVHLYQNFGLRELVLSKQDALDRISSWPTVVEFDTPGLRPRPHPRGGIRPVYPYDAMVDKMAGKVLVIALVDTLGAVAETEVRQSSGYPPLDSAAVLAVRAAPFTVGKLLQKKVMVRAPLRVRVVPE